MSAREPVHDAKGRSAFSDERTTVAELRRLVADFVSERDWERYHDPKNLSMAIAIEAAELMEHYQWVAGAESDGVISSPETRTAVCDEIADIACFLLALANRAGIDLAAEIDRKMARNREKYPADQFRGHYFKPGG